MGARVNHTFSRSGSVIGGTSLLGWSDVGGAGALGEGVAVGGDNWGGAGTVGDVASGLAGVGVWPCAADAVTTNATAKSDPCAVFVISSLSVQW
jgi:hypothetical protein